MGFEITAHREKELLVVLASPGVRNVGGGSAGLDCRIDHPLAFATRLAHGSRSVRKTLPRK